MTNEVIAPFQFRLDFSDLNAMIHCIQVKLNIELFKFV